MKWTRTRAGLAITIATVVSFLVMEGCASIPHDPRYDGESEIIAAPSDSVTLIPVLIENNRSRDVSDPTFYLTSNGKHSLGRVPDLSARRVFVDSRWLTSPDGRITITAHYAGGPDFTYETFMWRAGQTISISLDTIFNRAAAWSR